MYRYIIRIQKRAGPSAQQRVGIISGWSNDERVDLFQLAIGTRPAQKLHISEYSKYLLRPFGAPRLDFLDLLTHRAGFRKL